MRVLLLILGLAAIATGCENVVPADDLPYVDHIVIQGYLHAGMPIDSIAITHTLPLSVQYNVEEAALKDATVAVAVEGRSLPLTYVGSGNFSDPTREIIVAGKEYSIDVRWNGMHAWASTRIPAPPALLSQSVINIRRDTEFYRDYYGELDTFVHFGGVLKIGVQPIPGVTFGLMSDSIMSVGGRFYGSSNYYGYDYRQLHRGEEPDSDGVVYLTEGVSLDPSVRQYRASVTVGDADEAYYDFLRTYSNYDDNGVFGTAGTNPKWNVKGDGIGLFIGMAQTHSSFTFEW
jgi:hypothetical protein